MFSSGVNFAKLKKLNVGGVTIKNKSLHDCSTFRVGGNAKYWLEINTLESFAKIMLYLKDIAVKPFIIGNGSNLLISDKGYNGVVVRLKGDLARIENTGKSTIECGAGVMLSQVYAVAKDMGLGGLECSVGIPASIGGAVYMNASAYDFEMSKIVDYVIAFHNGRIDYFDNSQCDFGYRKSVFQSGDYVIIRVGLKLQPTDTALIESKCAETLQKRRETQPINYPSAGCVFRRMDGLNVSKMLDDMGAKGMSVGGAMVSKKHANFIVNVGNATAQDIYTLINLITNKFYENYQINLTPEIKILGDFDEITR